MRSDLADVRLADQVFAPHYAAPQPRRVKTSIDLRTSRAADSAVLATLSPGDAFELLDVTGETAWGIAPSTGFVGYVPASTLEEQP